MKKELLNSRKQTPDKQKSLHLLPGIIIVALLLLVRFVIPAIFPGDLTTQIGALGGILGGLAIIVWWAFFSRTNLYERWGAILLMIVVFIATTYLLHESIRTAMMGMMFLIFSIPVLSFAFVAGLLLSRRLSDLPRRAVMIATIVLATGFWTLLRTDGMTADAHHDLAWRWAKTAEERMLARSDDKLLATPPDSAAMNTIAEWPGFRGPNRDGIASGTQIETNWKKTPPVEMWRRTVGPGCSSFAIHGNLFFTQEQRGDDEVVSCYNLTTGYPVWKHNDKARFYDSHAGAGPRSTPTLSWGHVYTLGATGILNVLNAADGSVVWSRNAASDTGVKVLGWGFTGSPLVVENIVIVSLSGKLAAYDASTGNPLWSFEDGGNSYSSPHLVTIDGISQVMLMSKSGAISVDPVSGKQLWNYEWKIEDRILQPAFIAGGDLLLAGEARGIRRVSVTHAQNEWSVKELWTSDEMKVNFNDFIIHKGFAYGFDGPNLACIDIKDGKRTWKGNQYRGWLLLLSDQDLLLILSEKGELALVSATPEQFRELARIPALQGKTWNHPAFAGDVLLIRNAEEMIAYRLKLAGK